MVALVAALAALAVAGRLVLAPIPNVVATTDIVLITGYAVGRGPRLRGRGAGGRGLQPLARPGAVDAVADGGMGPGRVGRRGARRGHQAPPRPRRPRRRLRPRRLRLRGAARSLGDGHLRRRAVARPLPGDLRARDPVQRRPRRRQRRPGPRRRAGAGADDLSLPEQVRVHLAPGAGAVQGRSVRRRAGVGARRRRARSSAVAARGVAGAFRCRPGPASRRCARSGSSGRRTPTAASPPPPAAPRARRSRAGRCWGWRAPAAIRSTCGAPGTRRSATCARRPTALRSTGDLERTILALEGAGVSPRGFGGRDLVAELRRRRSASGSFEGQVNLTAFGILALRAAGAAASTLGALGHLAPRGPERRRRLGLSADASAATRTAPAPRSRAWRRPVAVAERRVAESTYLRRAQRARRRLRAGWRRPHQLAVNRLGDPGPGRRRGQSRRRPRARAQRHSTTSPTARRATATTATRRRATRRRSGSPGQALLAVNRKAFPLAAVPRAPAGGRSAPQASPASRTGASSGGGGSGSSGSRAGRPPAPQIASGGSSGEPGGAPARPERGSPGELASGEPVGAPVAADAPSSDHGGAAYRPPTSPVGSARSPPP